MAFQRLILLAVVAASTVQCCSSPSPTSEQEGGGFGPRRTYPAPVKRGLDADDLAKLESVKREREEADHLADPMLKHHGIPPAKWVREEADHLADRMLKNRAIPPAAIGGETTRFPVQNISE